MHNLSDFRPSRREPAPAGGLSFRESLPQGPDDYDDPPPAGSSAAVTIRCLPAPAAPARVERSYTVYAVDLDIDLETGEEVVIAGQPLSGKIGDFASARLVATEYAINPAPIKIPATHVVANDETGRERFRLPVFYRRAA